MNVTYSKLTCAQIVLIKDRNLKSLTSPRNKLMMFDLRSLVRGRASDKCKQPTCSFHFAIREPPFEQVFNGGKNDLALLKSAMSLLQNKDINLRD